MTKKIVLLTAALMVIGTAQGFAANAVTNGDFATNNNGWTLWTQRATGAACFNNVNTGCPTGSTANCLRYSCLNFAGGLHQALPLLINGNTYTVSVRSRNPSGGSTNWLEVHIATSTPSNGSDYSGGQNAKVDGTTWDAHCSTWAVDTCNSFVAGAGTYRVTLKAGEGTNTTVDVYVDDVVIDGVLEVQDWSIY